MFDYVSLPVALSFFKPSNKPFLPGPEMEETVPEKDDKVQQANQPVEHVLELSNRKRGSYQ